MSPNETLRPARIAVLLADGDPDAGLYLEALKFWGLIHQVTTSADLQSLGAFDALLLCGEGRLDDVAADAVNGWWQRGGIVVASGSTWDLESVLGVAPWPGVEHPSNDVLVPEQAWAPQWPEGAPWIRFFGGAYAVEAGCQVLARSEGDRPLVTANSRAYFFGPHVGRTMGLMQSGASVEGDGLGPNDGTARLDDGIWRAEDGIVLSFEADRVAGRADVPFFGYAHADALKEAWMRVVLRALDSAGLAAVMLWPWRNNAQAVAVLTTECEEFDPEHVDQACRHLAMLNVPTTWCVGLPGYALDVYRSLKQRDHEVGLLFATENLVGWQLERMRVQYTALARASGLNPVSSIRPLQGRWRGRDVFYELASQVGARISLSKGGRQPGLAGFPFGTCQPFWPRRAAGGVYPILEIPYALFEPGLVSPLSSVDPVVGMVRRRHGCLHVTIASDTLMRPNGVSGLRNVVTAAHECGVQFTLPERIYAFEQARRGVAVSFGEGHHGPVLGLTSEVAISGLSVLVSGCPAEATLDGKQLDSQHVERLGHSFTSFSISLKPKLQSVLCLQRLQPVEESTAA